MFGVQGKGKKGDPPFDHATRNGWLKHKDGQYYDALHVKRSIVILWLVEAFGGVCGAADAALHPPASARLARRSEGKNATDRTRYGRTRASTRSFVTHHLQQLSKAAVMHNAENIANQADHTHASDRRSMAAGRMRAWGGA